MINKGLDIKGIFIYKPGITYTRDDMIYYEKNLYLVTSGTYVALTPPDSSSDCMRYFEDKEVISNILTTKDLDEVIYSRIHGLTSSGLQKLTINQALDLDNLESNGVYAVSGHYPSSDSDEIEGILRVYQFNEVVDGVTHKISIQELLIYATKDSTQEDAQWVTTIPTIYYRKGDRVDDTNSWGGWSFNVKLEVGDVTNNFLEKLKLFNNYMSTLSTQIRMVSNAQLTTKVGFNTPSGTTVNSEHFNLPASSNWNNEFVVLYTYKKSSKTYQGNIKIHYDSTSSGSIGCIDSVGNQFTVTPTKVGSSQGYLTINWTLGSGVSNLNALSAIITYYE